MKDFTIFKKDFPIFEKNPGLIYLDSTATALKPRSVIEKITAYYRDYSANVHRGIYKISEKATAEYEQSRKTVATFINAKTINEVVFTRSTTESINLVAYCLGREIIEENDEVVVTQMEHHSNFVPWQMLATENGGIFKVIEVTPEGYLNIGPYGSVNLDQIITKKTKILALTYISNVLGTINPIKEIISKAKKINPKIITIVDAAQAVPHIKIDVQDLGCDFLAFSSHKMLGPTGVGVLWGRYELLDEMYPFQFGGDMIMEVSIEKTTFKKPPEKFEAGTPHIAGIIALQESINYLNDIGMEAIQKHEKELLEYALKSVHDAFGDRIKIYGPTDMKYRSGILSFTLEDAHPHDVAQILDESDVAVRAGHQCAMPLHTSLGIAASTRASFYIYNTKSDVDKLVHALQKVEAIFKR